MHATGDGAIDDHKGLLVGVTLGFVRLNQVSSVWAVMSSARGILQWQEAGNNDGHESGQRNPFSAAWKCTRAGSTSPKLKLVCFGKSAPVPLKDYGTGASLQTEPYFYIFRMHCRVVMLLTHSILPCIY